MLFVVFETYQQCSGVQARLVLLCVEVGPSEPQNSPVVPPQKETHCALDNVCENNVGPEFPPKNVLGGKFHQRGDVFPLRIKRRPSNHVHRYQNATAGHRYYDEDVTKHAKEPQEHHGVQTDCIHQLLFLDILDRRQPTEWLLAQGFRTVFLVSMFRSWGVDS